jgi:hypothetical protein
MAGWQRIRVLQITVSLEGATGTVNFFDSIGCPLGALGANSQTIANLLKASHACLQKGHDPLGASQGKSLFPFAPDAPKRFAWRALQLCCLQPEIKAVVLCRFEQNPGNIRSRYGLTAANGNSLFGTFQKNHRGFRILESKASVTEVCKS